MFKKKSVAVVIPCFNEEKLIGTTLDAIPDFVDHIFIVNDASTDKTIDVITTLSETNSKIQIVDLKVNQGIGGALIEGYKEVLRTTTSEYIGIVAGDAQFDSRYLVQMIQEMDAKNADYVKASRFFHREAFKQMPKYRQFGNIFISILTKFSTGYYSITDITNGCGFMTRNILEKVDFGIVKRRYDYETSMLTALSIAGAKVVDVAVPAHYGEETSTIKLIPTAMRNLSAVWTGFWRRIYMKYVVFGLHPIALFLFSGVFLFTVGALGGIWLITVKIYSDQTPSSGTIMLFALPIIIGFQMILTALSMDVSNEQR